MGADTSPAAAVLEDVRRGCSPNDREAPASGTYPVHTASEVSGAARPFG